jgi:histone H3/H4
MRNFIFDAKINRPMELYYQQERNTDFLGVCERIRKETKGYISVACIARKAVYCEAELFYLPAREIARIIRFKSKMEVSSPAKVELYREIEKRAKSINENGKVSCETIARIIEIQSAPRFYITEARAVSLYYELLKTKKNAVSNSNRFFNRVFGV